MNRIALSLSSLMLALGASTVVAGCVGEGDSVVDASDPCQTTGQIGAARLYDYQLIHNFNLPPGAGSGAFIFDDDNSIDLALAMQAVDARVRESAAQGASEAELTALREQLTTEARSQYSERWNQNGDGVVGQWDIAAHGDSLAQCPGLDGQANTTALNFWGPITSKPGTDGLPYEGFSASGGSVPVSVSVTDASMWEGIAFWAREAKADEAVPADANLYPNADRPNLGPVAPPQDGTSQLALMVQTRPTTEAGGICADYDPRVKQPGDEIPFRGQCYDAYRYQLEITDQWRFFRVPFSQMRQGGWGYQPETFDTTQLASIAFLATANQTINVLVDEVAFYRSCNGLCP